MEQPGGPPYRAPLFAGLAAVFAAAVLVVYLQHQSARQQQLRNDVVLEQMAERSAGASVVRVRELLGGAVLHTIEGIGHRELKAYDLTRVGRFFADGVRAYPYVSRFVLWHERLPGGADGEVLFYRAPGEPGPRDVPLDRAGGFFREPALGAAVWRAAQQLRARRKAFAVETLQAGHARYQLVVHFFWDNPRRDRIYALLGFIVDLDAVRTGAFWAPVAASLEPMLNPHPDVVTLTLRVEDEEGRVVHGAPAAGGPVSGAAEFELLFFPRDRLEHYATRISAVPRWRLSVTPVGAVRTTAGTGVWMLAGLVILLLAVAVVCAIGANRQATRLSELQADFAANVSHQLRTPLAMLSAAAETLRLERVRSPEKVKEYAEIVHAHAQRLSVLVDRILHVHRAELGGVGDVREPVELDALVERAADQFRVPGGREATIRVTCTSRRVVVLGDPTSLEHALTNLIDNALKYGRPADHEVRVAVGVRGREAVVTVEDSGIGIGPADLPHIFDKFYRGRGDGSFRRGFGLGLAIVRSTVALHGGRIDVTSEPGRGSEFTIRLPLAS